MKEVLTAALLFFISCFAAAGEIPSWMKPATASNFDCNRKYCKHMSSCSEAYYKFTECRKEELDRDRDGVPCENICGRTLGAMKKLLQQGE